MPKQFFLATQNSGKIQEYIDILKPTGWKLVLIKQLFKQVPLINESGKTFKQNALIKAKAWLKLVNYPILAEDSGLEVVALNGQPGVKSARYHKGSDRDRCLKLLSNMKDQTDRRARFVNLICLLIDKQAKPVFFQSFLNGSIAHTARGNYGFGYDSVFIPQGLDQTLAELGPTIKNSLSARSQSINQLKQYIDKHL